MSLEISLNKNTTPLITREKGGKAGSGTGGAEVVPIIGTGEVLVVNTKWGGALEAEKQADSLKRVGGGIIIMKRREDDLWW